MLDMFCVAVIRFERGGWSLVSVVKSSIAISVVFERLHLFKLKYFSVINSMGLKSKKKKNRSCLSPFGPTWFRGQQKKKIVEVISKSCVKEHFIQLDGNFDTLLKNLWAFNRF